MKVSIGNSGGVSAILNSADKLDASLNPNDNIGANLKQNPKIFVNQSKLPIGNITDLSDVDSTNKLDGSVLVYDSQENKFVLTTILEKQLINGGHY